MHKCNPFVSLPFPPPCSFDTLLSSPCAYFQRLAGEAQTEDHQDTADTKAPMTEILKKFYSIFIPVDRRSQFVNNQRRSADGEVDEEDFTYPTTRCLSSYYSIFVARLAIMVWTSLSCLFSSLQSRICSFFFTSVQNHQQKI